jgi:hypothetical protein
MWRIPQQPVPADPGPEDSRSGAQPEPDPGWAPFAAHPDPRSAEDQQAWLDHLANLDEPLDPEEWWDPDGPPPPGEDGFTPEELVEIGRGAAEEMLTAQVVPAGRRGPGQPGSARLFPGESASPATAFGAGMALDIAAASSVLALAADAAAEDGFDGVADHELVGLLCAWDRLEAHMAARKLAAVAELIRRRPEPGCAPGDPAPWDEFTADELAAALGESRGRAESLLAFARQLESRLPGTKAALWDGVIGRYKAEIIAYATALLDPAEARAAEALVLGRAGRLTPAGLRAAIARAVMEVAPAKARARREAAARDARVQRWAEDSGKAGADGPGAAAG